MVEAKVGVGMKEERRGGEVEGRSGILYARHPQQIQVHRFYLPPGYLFRYYRIIYRWSLSRHASILLNV
jgi:hypothetical protein